MQYHRENDGYLAFWKEKIMSDYSHIQTELTNGVLQVTFNRPKVGNALSLVMVQEIATVLENSKDHKKQKIIKIK